MLRYILRSENLWIDGYHIGDHVWHTHAFRELDWNSDPTLAKDLSLARSWFQQGKDNDYELYSPRPGKTIVMESIPEGFCTNTSETVKSTMKLYISGNNPDEPLPTKAIELIFPREMDWNKDGRVDSKRAVCDNT